MRSRRNELISLEGCPDCQLAPLPSWVLRLDKLKDAAFRIASNALSKAGAVSKSTKSLAKSLFLPMLRLIHR